MTKPQIASSHKPETGLGESDNISQPSIPYELEPKRILVVDDNSDIAFTLRMGLEDRDKNMQVFSYDNPVNALTDFKPNFYDLLLIDVNMPLMDGFDLCKKLLQKDINVKVCFMTSGEINMEAVREVHPLKSIGCFIKKPVTTDALIERIRAELE
ncbi:MAG TPA: response regulator [Nitrososphaeraceae archaeon]|jgi:DNA-binding response OmpR family regulator|nr:response regulator [Nitrososphaeraceae archaeon]